jgi:rhamnosyltransferase
LGSALTMLEFHQKRVPSVSLIIRTKNSDRTLDICLKSVFEQSLQPDQIIIVDSGSVDRTLNIAESYGCTVINYPKSIDFNYSLSLNLGINHAKGDYIWILSSHVQLLSRNTLKWMFEYLNESLLVKAVSIARTRQRLNNLTECECFERISINRSNFHGNAMYNYCSLIRKSDWRQYPFNENLPTCEDQEWMWHWMRNENAVSVIITNPPVLYLNPYYNIRKDIQEHYINGLYVYPYYRSWSYISELLAQSFMLLRNRKYSKAKHQFLLALGLFSFKLIPHRKLSSIYNNSLK